MEMDRIEFGALIRKRRKELGLTLNDLANSQVSVPTISNIERGVVYNVSEEKLTYIMERLGLTKEDIEEMARKTKQEEQRLAARISVARHLIQLKLYDEARRELSQLEKDGLDDFPYYNISVQLQKGILYRKLQQWGRAKRALQSVIRMAQESNVKHKQNLVAEANYFLSICAFYGDQDYKKAIEYADQALDAFQEDKENLYFKGQILHDKATYCYHLERYGTAYKYVLEAQKVSAQTYDIRLLILEYNLEGLILSEQQMYDNAIQTLEKAIALSRKYYPVPDTASLLYLNLAEMYCRSKAFDEAIRCLDIAHKLCQMTKDQNILAIIYYLYGVVYYETQELDKAKTYATKATKLAEKFELTSEYLQLLELKAKIALECRSEDIKEVSQEGIQLADKTNLFDKKKEFHYILAKYYVPMLRDQTVAPQKTQLNSPCKNLIREGEHSEA